MKEKDTVASMLPKTKVAPKKKAAAKKKAVAKKKAAPKKKRAAAKRRASITHTTTKTTRVEYASDPDKKAAKKVRARTAEGKFVGDDPNTPENEAWVEMPKEELPKVTKPASEPIPKDVEKHTDGVTFALVVIFLALIAIAFGTVMA